MAKGRIGEVFPEDSFSNDSVFGVLRPPLSTEELYAQRRKFFGDAIIQNTVEASQSAMDDENNHLFRGDDPIL